MTSLAENVQQQAKRQQVAEWLRMANRQRELADWQAGLNPVAASFIIALITTCEHMPFADQLQTAVTKNYGGLNGLAGAFATRVCEGVTKDDKAPKMAPVTRILATALGAVPISSQEDYWGVISLIDAVCNSFIAPKDARKVRISLSNVRRQKVPNGRESLPK